MRYLLDTCTICEARKKKPDRNVLAWIRAHAERNEFFISTVTIGEIMRGIARLPDSDPRKQGLADWLNDDILENFKSNILPFDSAAAVKWGEICGQANSCGNPRPPLDAQIVAIALVNKMTVVTRNISDISFGGVSAVNPWKER